MTTSEDAPLVLVSIRDGVGRLVLNRPQRRNAIDAASSYAFRAAVAELGQAGVHVAVLAANGPAFCAGADITEQTQDEVRPWESVLTTISSAGITWVAEVGGPAVGAGVAVVFSCAAVVMAESAWLALPELETRGRIPVPVMSILEPVIGRTAAVELGIGGRRVSANLAGQRGWVANVVTDEELTDRALSVAMSLAQSKSLHEFAQWSQGATPASLPATSPPVFTPNEPHN